MAADQDGTWGSVMFIPKGAALLQQSNSRLAHAIFCPILPKERAVARSAKPSEAEASTANLEPTHGASGVVAPKLAVTAIANVEPRWL